jgi:hypothetical protein
MVLDTRARYGGVSTHQIIDELLHEVAAPR